MVSLVLGSASPRRAELLAQLGVPFEIRSADIDETPAPGENAEDYVLRMAEEKSLALAPDLIGRLLLTADTTVVLDGESLGKPRDRDHAHTMLASLSGRDHQVSTAVVVRRDDAHAHVVVDTAVTFTTLSTELIDAYLDTDEPWDKAGAYAIQGLAGSFVAAISGSVSNVVGLPLVETRELLSKFGIQALISGEGVDRRGPGTVQAAVHGVGQASS